MLPEGIVWTHQEVVEECPKKPYDVTFWARKPLPEELSYLQKCTKTYTLFVPESVELDEAGEALYERQMGQRLSDAKIGDFLREELRFFFPHSYGEKFRPGAVEIAQDFTGQVVWEGNCEVALSGEFGQEMRQILYWRNNIPIMRQQTLDFWLEYEHSEQVEIAFVVTQLQGGSISNVQKVWRFDETQMREIVRVTNPGEQGYLFLHLEARGIGTLRVRALHDRHSRGTHGIFVPGGERVVTSEREEVFGYFDPGDLKPPLCVYFSGYKTRQGFEGAYMMKKFGCPFLLISEARLEGGSFYMGTQEYEDAVVWLIRKYMDLLQFNAQQVVLSGISMGSIGALYHGCEITPHAIIVGKPLVNCGSIAANERLRRPGGFPTSLDVLKKLCGRTNVAAVQALDEKFWAKFATAYWQDTRIIVSYMIEDDYDDKAYPDLLEHLDSSGVQIYGKGLHGRHNDNSGGIVSWFVSQYEKLLAEDFARSVEK
jgi:accessory secretory protein Asp2